jgi:hypothetical protein
VMAAAKPLSSPRREQGSSSEKCAMGMHSTRA